MPLPNQGASLSPDRDLHALRTVCFAGFPPLQECEGMTGERILWILCELQWVK